MLVCAHGFAWQVKGKHWLLLSHAKTHDPPQDRTYSEHWGLRVTDWPAQKVWLEGGSKQAVGARLTVTVVVAVASPQPPPKVARTQ
jgi:hypothetical protein